MKLPYAHTPAVMQYDLTMVGSPVGVVSVHSSVAFLAEMNAGLIKIVVSVLDRPVTCFALPLLGPTPAHVVGDGMRMLNEFIADDLNSVLAQWCIDEVRRIVRNAGGADDAVEYLRETATGYELVVHGAVDEVYADTNPLGTAAKAYLLITQRLAAQGVHTMVAA